MACMGMLGGVPWLCFLFYSRIFWPFKILFFVFYLILIIAPCKNYARIYNELKNNCDELEKIYISVDDCTYYLQKKTM